MEWMKSFMFDEQVPDYVDFLFLQFQKKTGLEELDLVENGDNLGFRLGKDQLIAVVPKTDDESDDLGRLTNSWIHMAIHLTNEQYD
jgi:hypothetical protein